MEKRKELSTEGFPLEATVGRVDIVKQRRMRLLMDIKRKKWVGGRVSASSPRRWDRTFMTSLIMSLVLAMVPLRAAKASLPFSVKNLFLLLRNQFQYPQIWIRINKRHQLPSPTLLDQNPNLIGNALSSPFHPVLVILKDSQYILRRQRDE